MKIVSIHLPTLPPYLTALSHKNALQQRAWLTGDYFVQISWRNEILL